MEFAIGGAAVVAENVKLTQENRQMAARIAELEADRERYRALAAAYRREHAAKYRRTITERRRIDDRITEWYVAGAVMLVLLGITAILSAIGYCVVMYG